MRARWEGRPVREVEADPRPFERVEPQRYLAERSHPRAFHEFLASWELDDERSRPGHRRPAPSRGRARPRAPWHHPPPARAQPGVSPEPRADLAAAHGPPGWRCGDRDGGDGRATARARLCRRHRRLRAQGAVAGADPGRSFRRRARGGTCAPGPGGRGPSRSRRGGGLSPPSPPGPAAAAPAALSALACPLSAPAPAGRADRRHAGPEHAGVAGAPAGGREHAHRAQSAQHALRHAGQRPQMAQALPPARPAARVRDGGRDHRRLGRGRGRSGCCSRSAPGADCGRLQPGRHAAGPGRRRAAARPSLVRAGRAARRPGRGPARAAEGLSDPDPRVRQPARTDGRRG